MEYEIKPVGKVSLNIKEIIDHKELFYFFTWRDIKVKYKQTVLGLAWAIIQPTLLMIVFTFLFKKTIEAQSNTSIPVPVFIYIGLMIYGIFAGGVQSAGNSMVNNANIIKKIYFPRLIIPISAILVSVFDFLMTLIPFVGLLIYYQVSTDWLRLFLFLPLSLSIIIITTFGMGTFIAALNVKYRDFRYVIPFMIQFLMFASPVFFNPTSITDPYLKFLITLNPICTSISLFRAIYEPLVFIDYINIGLGLFISIIFFLIGIYYFRKTEAYFADLA